MAWTFGAFPAGTQAARRKLLVSKVDRRRMSYLKRYSSCGRINRGKNISSGLLRMVQISPSAQGLQAGTIALVFLLLRAWVWNLCGFHLVTFLFVSCFLFGWVFVCLLAFDVIHTFVSILELLIFCEKNIRQIQKKWNQIHTKGEFHWYSRDH